MQLPWTDDIVLMNSAFRTKQSMCSPIVHSNIIGQPHVLFSSACNIKIYNSAQEN